MTEAETLRALTELAEQAGLPLLRVRGSGETEAGLSSGTCRVRGELRLVLVVGEPVARHIEVVAAALREHAADWLAERHLPPALREHLGE